MRGADSQGGRRPAHLAHHLVGTSTKKEIPLTLSCRPMFRPREEVESRCCNAEAELQLLQSQQSQWSRGGLRIL